MTVIANKTIILFFCIFSAAALQAGGDEFTIRITKKKHPYIDVPYTDTAAGASMLSWSRTYTLTLHDADLHMIQSVATSTGRLYRRDSILTLVLPDQQRVEIDSVTIAVSFRPGAHTDTGAVSRRLFISPNQKPFISRPWQRNGVYLRWGSDRVWHSPAWYSIRTLSYWSDISRRDLPGVADQVLRYQDYDSPDTTLHTFDSLAMTFYHRSHSYHYHISGSELSPEAAAMLSTARHNDSATLKMYYYDKAAGIVRRKTLYISLRHLIRVGGFFIITKG